MTDNTKITKHTDEIRSKLNKITDCTYEKLLPEIVVIIDNEISLTDNHEQNMQIICNEIFDIASSNKFYSCLYARLYNDLLTKYSILGKIVTHNFSMFIDIFNNIEYVSPEEDYNKFCDNNKKNERRRALSVFFINLMKLRIIKEDDIIVIIEILFKSLNDTINKINSKNIVDEIGENLALIVTTSFELLRTHVVWASLVDKMRKIVSYSVKDKPSLTNKTIFKFMDVLDYIK